MAPSQYDTMRSMEQRLTSQQMVDTALRERIRVFSEALEKLCSEHGFVLEPQLEKVDGSIFYKPVIAIVSRTS